MPITYKIDPDINLVYYSCRGLCTGAEFFQSDKNAFNDPLRRPNMKVIIDVQRAEADVSLEDIRNGIEHIKQLKKTGFEPEKTAVISNKAYAHTFSNAFHLLADGSPVKLEIFNDLGKAITWLGLSEFMEHILQIQNS